MSYISIKNTFHIKNHGGLRYYIINIKLFFECLTVHKTRVKIIKYSP